jgi:nucleoid-associated protein YgaU
VDAVPPGPAVPAALEADDARSGPQGPDAAPAPEAPAEEAQAEPEGRRVRVQPAENLRRIALREYGRWNDTVWQHIQKHNAWLEDPHKLKAGEELLLPPGDFSRKPEEKAP